MSAAFSLTPAGVVSVPANVFDRLRALSLAVLLIAAFAAAGAGGSVRGRGRQIRQRRFFRHRRSDRRGRDHRAIRWPFRSSARCRTAGCRPIRKPRKSSSPGADGKIIDAATGAAVDEPAGWRGRRPPQQPPAPHRRGRARRPDAAVARSRQAASRPRSRCSRSMTRAALAGDRRRAREGNQQGRARRPSPRRAPPSCSSSPTPPRSKSSKPSPSSRRAAIRKRWRC